MPAGSSASNKLNNKFRPAIRKNEVAKPITLTHEHREIINDLYTWMYEDDARQALLKAEMLRQPGRFELSNQLLQLTREKEIMKENGKWKYKYKA